MNDVRFRLVDYLRQKLLDNSESDLILHIARPQGSEKSHRSPEPHRAFLLKGVSHGRCPISRQSHSPRPHALCLFSPTTGRKLDVTDRPFLKQICNNPPQKKGLKRYLLTKWVKEVWGLEARSTVPRVAMPNGALVAVCAGLLGNLVRKAEPISREQGAGQIGTPFSFSTQVGRRWRIIWVLIATGTQAEVETVDLRWPGCECGNYGGCNIRR